jgi:hypothetical protein
MQPKYEVALQLSSQCNSNDGRLMSTVILLLFLKSIVCSLSYFSLFLSPFSVDFLIHTFPSHILLSMTNVYLITTVGFRARTKFRPCKLPIILSIVSRATRLPRPLTAIQVIVIIHAAIVGSIYGNLVSLLVPVIWTLGCPHRIRSEAFIVNSAGGFLRR